ncbi:MAG TPA: hypothetical protein VJ716_05760 [Gaiellaceae bacterium]|nr:hypothetical protein [Gaiellaceae bacterium]
MVEPDTSVLTLDAGARLRAAAFVLVAAGVVTWDAVAPSLDSVGLWPEVAVIAAGVLPATLLLIFLALPLWSSRRVVAVALVVFAIAAVVTWRADAHLASNFMKLAAYACGGWLFLWFFEELGWVFIIALIIPFVDAISVAVGPTNHIVHHHFAVYSAVAVAFVAPGGNAAGLGPPDILFFALFLAATVRWHLRPGWTWLAMTGMYSLTLILANATDASGLPALPFLSAGFLLANAGLLWRRLRRRPSA